MTTVAEIENAMVALVAAASNSGALGYRIRTVESYGGQLDGDDLAKMAKQFPAIYFVYGGEDAPVSLGENQYLHRPTFGAICVARLRGNEGRSRHGSDASPGSYQLFRDVRGLLVGQALDLDIAPIEPGRVNVLFDGVAKRENLSIISVDFHTAYADGATGPAAPDDFSTFHAAWDLPLHGNITDPAGVGDATDQLENLEA